jgi:hypothetical protein
MATEAQVLANRANAQKSTGPRTPGVSLAYFEISSLAIVVEGSRACPRENKANWRTPVVQTNPIPRGWLGSSYGGVEGQSVQNEPNFPIADCGLGRDLPPRASAFPGANCTNKPNSRTQSCETNPIPGSWQAQTRAHRVKTKPIRCRRIPHHSTIPSFQYSNPMPFVQNEPNSRRGRVGRGPRGVGRGAIVRNKPNLCRVARHGHPACEGGPWAGRPCH